jgi:hypothetical protein
MTYQRVLCVAASLGTLLATAAVPAVAEVNEESVPLIMTKPQGASFSGSSLRKLYAALKKRAGKATSQILPLTKTEVWTVPKAKVDDVRKAAARRGVIMSALGATWNHIFRKAPPDTKMNDQQKSMVEMAKASRATTGVDVMTTPAAPMIEYALTKDIGTQDPISAPRITVALSDATVLTIRRTGVEVRTDLCVWRGVVETTGAPATIMWWPGGRMTGTVEHHGRIYSIRHMGGQLHAVVEMDENKMPPEHAAMTPPMRRDDPNLRDDPLVRQGDASMLKHPVSAPMYPSETKRPAAGGQEASSSSNEIVIDIIVAYTKKAASNYTDVKRELVDLSIEEANESFHRSGIGQVKLRLVHAYQTDYVEEGTHFDHVWRFADKGDGYMDEIHPLRDKYKADVAVLIVDDPQGCGLATRVFADEDEAFAVVHHECAATTYSLAHEVGHLIGARHELKLDNIMTPFPYGHGYVNGTKWRDIMSYKDSCGGCPRLPVWSSPLVKVKGEPAGTPELDNARVIAEHAARVAAFR